MLRVALYEIGYIPALSYCDLPGAGYDDLKPVMLYLLIIT